MGASTMASGSERVTWASCSIRWATRSPFQALTFYYSGDVFLLSNPWIQKPKISNQKETPSMAAESQNRALEVQARKRLGAGLTGTRSTIQPMWPPSPRPAIDLSTWDLTSSKMQWEGPLPCLSAEEGTPPGPASGAPPIPRPRPAGLIWPSPQRARRAAGVTVRTGLAVWSRGTFREPGVRMFCASS